MKRRNLMAVVLAGVMAASVMGCASQSGAKNPSETQKEAAKEGASNESVSKDNESGAADSAAVPAGSWKPDHDLSLIHILEESDASNEYNTGICESKCIQIPVFFMLLGKYTC